MIDPEAVYTEALERLRDTSIDGIHTISRALSELEICTTGIVAREPLERESEFSVMADIDRGAADLRHYLDEAMRRIYEAVGVLERVRAI